MRIETARLALRPLDTRDLTSTHAYSSDVESTRYMMFLPNGNIGETEQVIRNAMAEQEKEVPSYYEFAVLLGDTHIGGIGLYLLEDGSAELGWILNKRYWGHGYAGEAARGVMEWARAQLGIRRFIAQCDAENDASRRVMERLGMRFVSRAGGRKNRSSEEERMELTYEINLE
ncbi:MAG: GNAT family N-acetyltransferase [Clostridia bacterium]|nr:GNAT family N-acetyltransferase [Clostridia bacterium]